jgi:sugar lactone lactonase YvrE
VDQAMNTMRVKRLARMGLALASIRRGFLVVVVLLLTATSASGVTGSDTITTIAGVGTAGSSGDGGQATSAQLNRPRGVAVDAQGNVYVADEGGHQVRKVSGGNITTVAGTGVVGYSGDGGQATSAQLNGPVGIALDAQGNLYISDRDNHRIRKVSGGIITTVAGTGVQGYSGDGGQATSAQINSVYGIALDAQGNLYLADYGGNRVRKVSSSGTISTVAGTGVAGFSGDGGQATSAQVSGPIGVAVDPQGNLYIADLNNNRVRKVSSDGIINTVAGTGTTGFSGDGGQATSAQISAGDVTLDAAGNLYIADFSNSRIRQVTGGIITTIAGTTKGFSGDGGPASSAQLSTPAGLTVDGQGSLYVTDVLTHRLRKIENKLPTASFTLTPASGTAPLTVSVDGSASADPDGQVTAYAWQFGDGGTASGAKATHNYAAAGTFTIKLTVTDSSGTSASTTKSVTASAAPPPPPPPPPPPTAPKLKASKLTVGKAVAGKTFAVSLTVKNTKTGKGVKGSLSCTGKLAGKSLRASGHSSTAAGKAGCTWKLPGRAHGKRFTGKIAGTFAGVKVSRSFSVNVH